MVLKAGVIETEEEIEIEIEEETEIEDGIEIEEEEDRELGFKNEILVNIKVNILFFLSKPIFFTSGFNKH